MRRIHGIYVLDGKLEFPNVSLATEEGVVAVGGDFSTERLLLAYRSGIFPWTEDPISWWSPNPRGIIPLDGFHVPKRLDREIRRGRFRITFDGAFERVIRGCASPHQEDETWITEGFIEAYVRLHREGHAHSVECWMDDELAGGVYGVAMGGFFAGESMFHVRTNASSIALVVFLRALRECGFELFDTQMVTAHTERFGAVEISRDEYMLRLRKALKVDAQFPVLVQGF